MVFGRERTIWLNGRELLKFWQFKQRRQYAFDRYKNEVMFKLKSEAANVGGKAYGLLIFPATSLGLGIWQYFRHVEKTALIQNMRVHMKEDPIPLPEDLRDLLKMEYAPIKVSGEFLHDEEFVIQPRSRMDGHTDRPFTYPPLGGSVVTPFKVAGRKLVILIARGWVPLDKVDKTTRPEGQVEGQVELVGINRLAERRPPFAKASNPAKNFYSFRDLDSMAYYHDTAPVFLEAVAASSVPGGPVGGQTRVSIKNDHFNYMLTWFSLSAATLFMWIRRYYKIR